MISCSPFVHYHNFIGLYSIPHCLPSCYRDKVYVVAPRPAVVPFLSMWAVLYLSAFLWTWQRCKPSPSPCSAKKDGVFQGLTGMGLVLLRQMEVCSKRSFPIYQTTCRFRPMLLNGSSWQKIVFPGLNYPVLSDFFFPFVSQMDGEDGPLDSEIPNVEEK